MNRTEKYINNDRRRFLELATKTGVTGGLLRASPLVAGLLANRHAQAAEAFNKRVIFVYTPDGSPGGNWLPSGNGSGINLAAATQAYGDMKTYCNFRAVTMKKGGGHGNTLQVLGGSWDQGWRGYTLDVQMADTVGKSSPYSLISLGVQANRGNHGLIGARGGNQPVACEDNPAQAYRRLFNGAAPSGGNSAELTKEMSVYDTNKAALAAMKNKLGAFEKERLDQHTAAIDAMSNRLKNSYQNQAPSGCSSPQYNPKGYANPDIVTGNFHETAELQTEILVLALSCGLTKIATLQLGNHQAEWKASGINFTSDHHAACHSFGVNENIQMVNYLSARVAFLIRRLAETTDPLTGGKMIDNTLVVQVTDMGNGRDHTPDGAPNMVACGPGFPGFKRGTTGSGGTNEDVLAAVVQGLGLSSFVGQGITNFGNSNAGILA
jgi:hypothetical protein